MSRNVARVETLLTDTVAKVAPWVAPIPTAYLVGRATVVHLHWPTAVGVVAAIIVESLGLATTVTALELREYNQSKRKSDPGAPFVLAGALVAVYVIVAIGLTVALDIVPALAVYAPAIFPLLSLCGVTVLALRGDHKRRVEAVEQDKAARRAARRAAQEITLPDAVPERMEQHTKTAGMRAGIANTTGTRAQAKAILAEHPGISGSELGRMLGRSARLGRKLKAELLPGISGSGNGTGEKAE